MKRAFFIIGFLLLPMTADAQIVTEALSPWVQGVLDRVDAGITMANGLPGTSCSVLTMSSEVDKNQALIRALVNPALQREAEVASLRETTVCYRSDKHRLELKIREVQDAMSAAVQACKISTGNALRETYKFLMGAYESYLRGGTNPAYSDDLLRYRHPFHDITLWNSGVATPVTETGSTAPICPYTTDYGVHSIGYVPTSVGGGAALGGPLGDVRSFGCDKDVLAMIPPPYDKEAQALRDFMDQSQGLSTSLYNTVHTTLFNLENVIGILTGTLPPSALRTAKPPPPHAELTGCLKPLQPNFESDPPADIDAFLSLYPDYFESYNLRDNGSGGRTYDPLPDERLPTGVLHVPVIDYFLSTPNAGILTRSYIDLRENAGAGRPLPDYLVSQMFDSFLHAITRSAVTGTRLRQISANIEREMGIFESGNTDALQRMQDSSVPLEAAVQALIHVVDTELPEKYIPELAFFLARSCVHGHCQRTLDAVLKRTFNPYCHPYVSGKYLEDDAHKRCFCASEIQGSDPDFWKQYCSADYSDQMERYNNMRPELIPACVDETVPRR